MLGHEADTVFIQTSDEVLVVYQSNIRSDQIIFPNNLIIQTQSSGIEFHRSSSVQKKKNLNTKHVSFSKSSPNIRICVRARALLPEVNDFTSDKTLYSSENCSD